TVHRLFWPLALHGGGRSGHFDLPEPDRVDRHAALRRDPGSGAVRPCPGTVPAGGQQGLSEVTKRIAQRGPPPRGASRGSRWTGQSPSRVSSRSPSRSNGSSNEVNRLTTFVRGYRSRSWRPAVGRNSAVIQPPPMSTTTYFAGFNFFRIE